MASILDYGGKRIWTIPCVAGPHYLRTQQTGEDILIHGGDIPPKRNSKKRPLAAEFYFRLKLLTTSVLGTFVESSYKISAKTIGGRVTAIQIIQDGRRPPSWIMEESVFGHSARCETQLSIYTRNLVTTS